MDFHGVEETGSLKRTGMQFLTDEIRKADRTLNY